jgi:hypothetical protein
MKPISFKRHRFPPDVIWTGLAHMVGVGAVCYVHVL